jgi:hypothetical protein
MAVMAFAPLRSSQASAVVATGAGIDMWAAVVEDGDGAAEEDCEELVSHDMVICGAEYFDAADLELSALEMPREQCQEMLAQFAADLECDPNDDECRRRSAQRGDTLPLAQRTSRVLHMATVTLAFPDLLRRRGVANGVNDWAMPHSLSWAPPPRPPQHA